MSLILNPPRTIRKSQTPSLRLHSPRLNSTRIHSPKRSRNLPMKSCNKKRGTHSTRSNRPRHNMLRSLFNNRHHSTRSKRPKHHLLRSLFNKRHLRINSKNHPNSNMTTITKSLEKKLNPRLKSPKKRRSK
jgi:hypothetical protein